MLQPLSSLETVLQVIQNVDSRTKIQLFLEKLFQNAVRSLTVHEQHPHVIVKLHSSIQKQIHPFILTIPEELHFLILDNGYLSFDLPEFSPSLTIQNRETIHCDSINPDQNNYRFVCLHSNQTIVRIVVSIETFLTTLSDN